MFSKTKFYRRGIPTFIAFLFLWFVGDPIILPFVFGITDSGNINLLIWILVDAIMFFTMFYVLYVFSGPGTALGRVCCFTYGLGFLCIL